MMSKTIPIKGCGNGSGISINDGGGGINVARVIVELGLSTMLQVVLAVALLNWSITVGRLLWRWLVVSKALRAA